MPSPPWTEALRMAGSGAVVAAGVVPVVVLLARVRRRPGVRIVPPRRAWPAPWTGVEVVALFAGVFVFAPAIAAAAVSQFHLFERLYGVGFPPPSATTVAAVAGTAAAEAGGESLAEWATLAGLWVGFLAVPLQLGLVAAVRAGVASHARTLSERVGGAWLAARLILAGRAWLVLTPVVFVVHFAVVYAFNSSGVPIETHPLTKIGPGRPPPDRALFVVQACLFAPLVEETLCRGVLLPWAARAAYRPWLVLAAAVALPLLDRPTLPGAGRLYTFAWGLILAAGWVVPPLLGTSPRTRVGLRRWGAVYSSAAFFGCMHFSVWPNPVPLFVLGLGLGWLGLRTRGVFAPVVVHGLFNVVSVVYVLRGPAG